MLWKLGKTWRQGRKNQIKKILSPSHNGQFSHPHIHQAVNLISTLTSWKKTKNANSLLILFCSKKKRNSFNYLIRRTTYSADSEKVSDDAINTSCRGVTRTKFLHFLISGYSEFLLHRTFHPRLRSWPFSKVFQFILLHKAIKMPSIRQNARCFFYINIWDLLCKVFYTELIFHKANL